MNDRRFFASQLGQAAVVSIAAMITFTILATMHGASAADVMAVGLPGTSLA